MDARQRPISMQSSAMEPPPGSTAVPPPVRKGLSMPSSLTATSSPEGLPPLQLKIMTWNIAIVTFPLVAPSFLAFVHLCFFGGSAHNRFNDVSLVPLESSSLGRLAQQADYIRRSGADIIMLQDSGEHFSYVTNKQRRPFFDAMHQACRASSAKLWGNVEVAEWDELPPLEAPEEELLAAEEHSGCRRRYFVDVQKERGRHGADAAVAVVAKFGERSHMGPVWMFPQDELATLFQAASLTESMFVALEHMQVPFVTAQKTRLTKFRKT